MVLRLYNTLRKGEEDFVPRDLAAAQGEGRPARVTLYTCGPTVYGRPHIGNYAAFLAADLLCRWLEAGHGYVVHQVKNITDVGHLVRDADSGEDKIEKQAREEHGDVTHQSVLAVAKHYEALYIKDEESLNIRKLEPKDRPHASDYVPQMVTMVESLLASGHAYAAPDGIYFDVTSKTPTPYGSLSGNTLDHLSAGARVEVNESKRHPADFALWKFCVGINEHHVLRWPSPKNPAGEPWPEGFPGWHIECSAMSRALLGDQIDLHTGGEDNIFPHHECEIAQSECVTGKSPFVSIWLHRRRLDLKGDKMSKSLGNVVSLDDIVAKGYSLMDLRYYLLSVHYRTNLKFDWEGLEGAKIARDRIMDWMARDGRGELSPADASPPSVDDILKFEAAFTAAMNSDLNVSGALAQVFDAIHYVNTHGPFAAGSPCEAPLDAFIAKIRHTFGCFDPEVLVISPQAQALLDARDLARKNKDFAASDRLRDELLALGWQVKDTKDGQKLSRA